MGIVESLEDCRETQHPNSIHPVKKPMMVAKTTPRKAPRAITSSFRKSSTPNEGFSDGRESMCGVQCLRLLMRVAMES